MIDKDDVVKGYGVSSRQLFSAFSSNFVNSTINSCNSDIAASPFILKDF